MTTYAIGDIQGCYETFMALLDRIGYRPGRDRLWLTGDLVNRGPKSLEVLRWCAQHDTDLVCVLGNHDLHLLMRAAGVVDAKRFDTLDAVLEADDCSSLVDWLAQRPLVHVEDSFWMVHAGFLPQWDQSTIVEIARRAEAMLRGSSRNEFLAQLSTSAARQWANELGSEERIALGTRIFCYLRTCTPDGQPAFDFKGPPDEAPKDRIAWHAFERQGTREETVVCGHWAAQGLRVQAGMIALDSGAVWGGSLTAIDLETRATTSQPALDAPCEPPPGPRQKSS